MVTSPLKKKKKTPALCKQCFSLVPLYLSPHGEDTLNVNRKDSAAANGSCLFTPPHPPGLLDCLQSDSSWTGSARGSGPGATGPQVSAAHGVQAANTAWLLEPHWPAALSLAGSLGH